MLKIIAIIAFHNAVKIVVLTSNNFQNIKLNRCTVTLHQGLNIINNIRIDCTLEKSFTHKEKYFSRRIGLFNR